MIQVDRRLLAWVVSIGLGCLGVVIAARAVWPYMPSSGSGGLGAVSVGLPAAGVLPLIIGNIALSVIARRRPGRTASIGSFCLWTLGILIVVTLAVSLMPPAVAQSISGVFFIVLLLLLALGASLPVQLVMLAILTFAVIGNPRTPRATGHTP